MAPKGFSLTIEHPAERMMLRVLAGALICLAFCYVYLVSATVLNVVARRETAVHTTHLSTDVSELERAYFAASAGISPESAGELGLVPVAHVAYVHRLGNAAAASLSVPHNEI